MSALMHIPRLIDLCGNVPVHLVYYALCGHAGRGDTVGTYEDDFWTIRDKLHDEIMPDEAREKARLQRIAMKMDPSIAVSMKVLCLLADGDPDVLAELEAEMQAARVQREETRLDATEGLPVHKGSTTADDGQHADDIMFDDIDDDIPAYDDDMEDDDIADDHPFGEIC
jgi:hypothetical protein